MRRLILLLLAAFAAFSGTLSKAQETGFISDNGTFGSFRELCAKAESQNATLMISRVWNSLPSQMLACSKLFLKGGELQAAARATLTISPDFVCPEYRQCFDITTNPGAALVISGTSSQVNPNWFGADWTGVKDSLPALKAAYASGDILSVPAGKYSLSGQFVMNRNGTSLLCPTNRSILSYAGIPHISSIVLATLPQGISRTTIEGCTFSGNENIMRGDVELVRGGGNIIRDILCESNSRIPPAACIYFFNGNTNTAENIQASGQNQALPHPALLGIVFEDEVNSFILRPKLEEITNEGIKLFHGAGTACNGNTVIGGTSEGNGSGISIPSCHGNLIVGLDMEAIAVQDVLDGGSHNHFINVSAGQPAFTGTARNSVFEGGNLSGWTIDAGAVGVSIRESSFANNPGKTIDNGLCSSFIHNRSANGGNYWPDQIGCQNGLIIQQSFNRVGETPSTSITAARCTANVITFTAPGHLLSPNFLVTITGATPGGYNVAAAKVTVIGESQFSVPVSICPAAWVSGGRVTGSADNALVGSFSPPSYFGSHPVACPAALDRSLDGMLFYIELAHSLQAGTNTFNFCGFGAKKIVKASDGRDGGARVPGSGVTIALRYVFSAGLFVDMGQ